MQTKWGRSTVELFFHFPSPSDDDDDPIRLSHTALELELNHEIPSFGEYERGLINTGISTVHFVDFDWRVPGCYANSARFAAAQSELCAQWSRSSQIKDNKILCQT